MRVDDHLRVRDGIYALGDIANADRNMAGMAGMQADLLAANLRALITGEGETAAYAPAPPMIAIPLGPEGGAGQFPNGVVGPEVIAGVKGRSMLVERFSDLFDQALSATDASVVQSSASR